MIESRSILKISKPVYETNGPKVVKTGIVTKWLIHKANKFLLLSAFMLLPKPQVQNVTEKPDISNKPKSDSSVEPINVGLYPRIG